MNFLTSSEKMEKIFEKYFQRNIHLYVKDDLMKKGKFLLIKNCIISNNYFFEFTIERGKKHDLVRIPYPFEIEEHADENLIYMDYRISSLFKQRPHLDKNILEWMKKIDARSPSKLFDNILEIQFE